jgi:hypothetical protein
VRLLAAVACGLHRLVDVREEDIPFLPLYVLAPQAVVAQVETQQTSPEAAPVSPKRCASGTYTSTRPWVMRAWRSPVKPSSRTSSAMHTLISATVRRLTTRLDVMVQVVPQVEQPLLARNGDGLEIRLPVDELHAMLIEQAEFRRTARVVNGDDEIEVG